MKTNQILLLFLICLLWPNLKSQSVIEGQLNIDTAIWTPIIYLSIIKDFDDLNTISGEMILEQTDIDAQGRFRFNTTYLPDEDAFYRIHIARRTDPPASLIIGGKDENHFFLIANRHSSITIYDSTKTDFIKDVTITGYYPNLMIHQINEIASYLDSTRITTSVIKYELIRNAIYEKLRNYADTCSNPLVSLYALYKSGFENNLSANQQYYKKFLTKWKNEKSSYFLEFKKKFPSSAQNKIWFYLILCISFFILGFLVSVKTSKLLFGEKNPVHNLTQQERKIFTLILEGKSNKEISDALNIGLSTAKSHISNIYSKLGLSSRKDALNLNLDRKDKPLQIP